MWVSVIVDCLCVMACGYGLRMAFETHSELFKITSGLNYFWSRVYILAVPRQTRAGYLWGRGVMPSLAFRMGWSQKSRPAWRSRWFRVDPAGFNVSRS